MSVAQLLKEAKALSTPELQLLALSLQLEQLRRVGIAPSEEELRWLEVLSRPLMHNERLSRLSEEWEDEGLSESERIEMLSILGERESQNAQRAEAVQHLSELTNVPFQTLWDELVGESTTLLFPRN